MLRVEHADESDTAENANGAAERHAAFSHWMLTTEPAT